MAVASEIRPSRSARELFGKMVARASNGVLSIEASLGLGVERAQRGEDDPGASREIHELVENEWIEPDRDEGGWLLH